MESIFQGQIVAVDYEGNQLRAIVIDPNGIGEGKPSMGLGLRMSKEYLGIAHNTLSDRVVGSEEAKRLKLITDKDLRVVGSEDVSWLKLPSGKALRVTTIVAEDNNNYKVLEFGDWAEVAKEYLRQAVTGKSRLSADVLLQLIDFIGWFAVKGFYASASDQLKGAYTQADDDALTLELFEENDRLLADKELLQARCDRLQTEKNQLQYRIDAIREVANSPDGIRWLYWELQQADQRQQ